MTLSGRIALVAGATRGAGRGIATALGEAGAVVYCSGRSSRSGDVASRSGTVASGSDPTRPETIEETAELVTAAGGTGIAVPTDHTHEAAVVELVTRVANDHGRLDILVNDIWGGDALTEWGKPFWEVDVQQGFAMLERAVHTHVITSRLGVPLMLERDVEQHGEGLVVEVTDGAFAGYRGQLFYDLCKASVMRLAYAMATELRDRPATALAITPGFLRSEAVLAHFGVSEDNWRDAIRKDPHFAASETPRLVGRAIAALAADREVRRFAGRTLTCWDVTREYDLRDVDGRQPHWEEHLDRAIEATLASTAPSADELMVLQFRLPQLDFDAARADQRARIAAFLERHSG